MTIDREGQYQIGNLKFGSGTQYMLQSIEAAGYTVSVGDYARAQSDEVTFSKDYIQPGQLMLTVSAMDNYKMNGQYDPSIVRADQLMEDFMAEWRADDVRSQWGYTKPIIYRRGGQVRRVYGRPRDISASPRKKNPGWYDMVCTYQRADTFTYSEEVFGMWNINPTAVGVNSTSIVRGDGKAPTWLDIGVVGPITNPVIDIGPLKIELLYTLPAGQTIQINSNPWERRIVNNSGANLVTKMIGASPFLDEIRFPAGASYAVGLHGGATTAATKLNIAWREAYGTF